MGRSEDTNESCLSACVPAARRQPQPQPQPQPQGLANGRKSISKGEGHRRSEVRVTQCGCQLAY